MLIVNPATAIAEHGSAEFTSITRDIRSSLFRHMAKAPPGEIYVLTDALEEGGSVAEEVFDALDTLAARRGVPLLLVSLECDAEENVRRLVTETRGELHKLRDADILMGYRRTLTLMRPDTRTASISTRPT